MYGVVLDRIFGVRYFLLGPRLISILIFGRSSQLLSSESGQDGGGGVIEGRVSDVPSTEEGFELGLGVCE